MAYTPDKGREFWFAFDEKFLPSANLGQEVKQIYIALGFNFDLALQAREDSRLAETYPDSFIAALQEFGEPIAHLLKLQLALIDTHFPGNADDVQRAFEDFGMGVLYNPQRPVGRKVHMMDTGGPSSPPIGYHRWHGYSRGAVLLGVDAERWERLDRNIGLAWNIQSILKPVQDKPNNPPMDDAKLAELRNRWQLLTTEEIEQEFDSFPYPPGVV